MWLVLVTAIAVIAVTLLLPPARRSAVSLSPLIDLFRKFKKIILIL